MVDNTNPTTQFHPYQPETSIPHTESMKNASPSGLGGLGNILNKVGLGHLGGLGSLDVRGGFGKMQGMARNNSSLVLGGLAALAIGAGLMRRRSMRHSW